MGSRRNGYGSIRTLESHPRDSSATQNGIEFLDHRNALNAYNRVHQGQYKSLGDYKKRFELAVEALEAIEHPNIPVEGARVSHFVELLNGNYNEWKRDLMNGIRQGRVEPPANVTADYRLASSYILVDGSTTAAGHRELVANAFVTKATNKDSRRRVVIASNQAKTRRSPKTRL